MGKGAFQGEATERKVVLNLAADWPAGVHCDFELHLCGFGDGRAPREVQIGRGAHLPPR